jgi:hypothetical protein
MAGLAHGRQYRLGERDRPEVVDLELIPDVLQAQLLGGAHRAASGVVDQHIYPAVVGRYGRQD